MKEVKLSVLMPAYNVAAYVGEAIASVLNQSFKEFELVIVDDGSTDDTANVIRSFNDERIVFINQENKGVAAALNKALQIAKGDYVARFDADDICYPHRLAKQYNFMVAHSSCVIAGSSADYVDETGEYVFTNHPPAYTNEEIKAVAKKTCPFIHSSVICKKVALLKHGGYNEYAHSFEDHLLWQAVLHEGKAVNFQEPLIQVRLNPASVTVDERWRPRNFHRIKQRVIKENFISEKEGEQLLRILQSQNNPRFKESAYHALLAKKFLWNNYQPQKARRNLEKVLAKNKLHWKSYCLYALSFLPRYVLHKGYRILKPQAIYASNQKTVMSKRLKIFVDAHCLDTEYQGSRTFVREIYRAMSVKKDLVLYLAANNTERLQENFTPGENIVFLKYRSANSFLRLAYEIPRLIRKHKIDVAHFQYITPLFKNCRQVVTIHDVIFNDYPGEFSKPYRLLKHLLYKRSTKTADVLTTVSAFSKASIQKHLKTNGHAVHVIANGVSEKFFTVHDKEKARVFLKEKYGFEKIILYVSRIEPRKNHAALLKAYLDLKAHEQGYHLVFIGHETAPVAELNALRKTVAPEAKQSVHFFTNVGEEELLQFYRAAHLFVYPSKAEGFGIPPLEAGAVGVPVLCSASSAMREFRFFGDGLVDSTNEESLKKALEDVLQKEHDAGRLKKISERIRADYSWETSAEKLYQLILKN